MTQSKIIRPVYLTNTLSGEKELLVPFTPGKLNFYSCGPTVYGLIHIGNLRGGLVSDLFFRYFQKIGYDVTYVRNYTDVDDKIIKKANEEGCSSEEIAKRYTQEVEKDFAVSGMLSPTHKTTVTTHIQEIIEMIQKLILEGHAYVTADGEVLYSIESFKDYGKLSHKKIDDLIAGLRVEVSSKKKNPLDFTLWKPAKPNEPYWKSPWTEGRPGWHIECSAMASKWLGEQIDVHHGGEDLIFPHHENEIAQSEAAHNKAPFVKYWVHHAFLTLSKEKMSKSIGNILTARDFLTRYSGEIARYLLLSVHYKSRIDFSIQTLEQTIQGLQRIYETKLKAFEVKKTTRIRSDLRAEAMWGNFMAQCEATQEAMDDAFANDMNTPQVLASVFLLIREWNKIIGEPLALATPSAVLGAEALLHVIEEELGQIMGIGRLEPASALEDLARIRHQLLIHETDGESLSLMTQDEILKAIQERNDARKQKDFSRSDSIRKMLEQRGVLILDGPTGTTWKYK